METYIQFETVELDNIHVRATPLGEGAEGLIYEVILPHAWDNYVVKVYKDASSASARLDKIQYLIRYAPSLQDPFRIIFPEKIIYKNGRFCGFLLKKARGSEDLSVLSAYRLPKRLDQAWQDRFDRSMPAAWANRLEVCRNIASAIQELHQTQRYTLVDIKPENIKVGLDSEVSLVDMDSVAIAHEGDLLFPAEKLTPEYSPLESKQLDFKTEVLPETWDRFSMAVLFYKILFGIHPYTGSCEGVFADLTTNEQKIAEGLFPMGQQAKAFSIIPEPHQAFRKAPRLIRELFLQCFESGHTAPEKRPSAQAWQEGLERARRQARRNFLSFLGKRTTAPAARSKTKASLPHPSPSVKQTTRALSKKPKSKARHALQLLTYQGIIPTLVFTGGMFAASFYGLNAYEKSQMLAMQDKYGDLNTLAEKSSFQQIEGLLPVYSGVYHSSSGLVWALKQNNKYILTDTKNTQLSPQEYDTFYDFNEGIAIVKIDNKYGYINDQGHEITPISYDYAQRFSNGKALIRKGSDFYIIDRKGDVRFKLDVEALGDFREGLASCKIDGWYGFIDFNGKVVIPAQYDFVYPFNDGLAAVRIMDKYGFVDKTGTMHLDFQYDYASSFSNGRAQVRKGTETYWIDRNGRVVPE